MKKVFFTIYDMGRGHRSTANALQALIERRKLPWQVEIVEVFREVFGTNLPQFLYNQIILPNEWVKKIIDRPIAELLKPENYLRYRTNIDALNNRAVFEVVDLLTAMLASDSEPNIPKAIAPPSN